MDSQAFEYRTMEDGGMKITLEFPCDPEEKSIILEVKSILSAMFKEYLEKIS